uniref:Leukotriene C4 synthase n=1 Tax=Oncorhynchus tshawytscha TaxID=74940 RepID=A0A8C8JKD9_ONCTS
LKSGSCRLSPELTPNGRLSQRNSLHLNTRLKGESLLARRHAGSGSTHCRSNGVGRVRARANCSEYFPIFIIILWVSGLFFSQGLSALCGLLYLYGRYQYFRGYAKSAHGRLAPLYFSAKVLWVLIGFSALGILGSMCRFYLDLDLKQLASSVLDLTEEEGGGL